jgi:competence protein ComGF
MMVALIIILSVLAVSVFLYFLFKNLERLDDIRRTEAQIKSAEERSKLRTRIHEAWDESFKETGKQG